MLRSSSKLLLLLFLAGTTAACGSDSVFGNNGESGSEGEGGFGSEDDPAYVSASDFDQGCETGSDCVVVFEQACLECEIICGFDQNGVNKDGLREFEAAKEAVECEAYSSLHCPPGSCELPTALCLEGQCTAWRLDRSNSPRDCTSDDECIAICDWEPENCWPQECPDLAVNKADWETAIDVDCDEQDQGTPPSPADCTGPTVPRCDEGSCVLAEQ